MNCPACGAITRIIETRQYPKWHGTWRRHKCFRCMVPFDTLETKTEAHRIALTKYINRRLGRPFVKRLNYGKDWKARTASIRARDGKKCQICGHTERLAIDHIIPLRLSHCNDLDNLITLCKRCHAAKTGSEQSLKRGNRAGFEQSLRTLGWNMLIVERAFRVAARNTTIPK